MKRIGRVALVGAGPGDPDLLTVMAVREIAGAQAVVYDRLVSAEILALAPASARMVDVGKAPGRHSAPQERINALLCELALEGLHVVRLKGGDPFVFGRGAEEMDVLRAAGVPVVVVPGITAAQGAAAAAGLPLTHRGMATGLRYVTGHCREDRPLTLDWDGLADPETTLVVYMGVANIRQIARELIARGMPRDLPAMAVSAATTEDERRLVSRLDSLAADAAEAALTGPALFIIGRVVSLYHACPIEALVRQAACEAVEPVHA